MLAAEVGIKWPEVLDIEHYMLGVYYDEAQYERKLKNYEAGATGIRL